MRLNDATAELRRRGVSSKVIKIYVRIESAVSSFPLAAPLLPANVASVIFIYLEPCRFASTAPAREPILFCYFTQAAYSQEVLLSTSQRHLELWTKLPNTLRISNTEIRRC